MSADIFAKGVGVVLVTVSSVVALTLIIYEAKDDPGVLVPFLLLPTMFICGLGLLGVFG